MSQGGDQLENLADARQQNLLAGGFQHQRMRQVVDVFGGAGKVNELGYRVQFRIICNLLFEEILDRLDVMIGGSFDFLDAPRLSGIEVNHERIKYRVGGSGKLRNLLRFQGFVTVPATSAPRR